MRFLLQINEKRMCFERFNHRTKNQNFGNRQLNVFYAPKLKKKKDALPLMKELKFLKNKYHLSLLILSHTPKRDLSKPITRNDLQGSKMLINLCDSSFSIGERSTDKGIRYIKMIKARNT